MLPPLSMASAQRQHHLHAQCRCCSLQGHQGLPVHKYLLPPFLWAGERRREELLRIQGLPGFPDCRCRESFCWKQPGFFNQDEQCLSNTDDLETQQLSFLQGLDGGIWESFCQDACAWQQRPPRPSINRTLEMWNKTDKGQWLYWIYPKTFITPTHFDQSCLCF